MATYAQRQPDRASERTAESSSGAALHPALNARSAVTQAQAVAAQLNARSEPVQRKPSRSDGLPDPLRASMEAMSGIALDDVRVHRNSDKPAQMQAHAYAQGTDIHLAPGQEKHLPHEAWHVVQQKQGRVRATRQMKGALKINDDPALESEADRMGAEAILRKPAERADLGDLIRRSSSYSPVQRISIEADPLNSDGLGTFAKATINGKNDVGAGSSPSVRPSWWPTGSSALAIYCSNYMVQGHLINHNLGGPGDTMLNLSPITKSANATHHSFAESHVKSLVDQDYRVVYDVWANYSHHPDPNDMGVGPSLAASHSFQAFCAKLPWGFACQWTAMDASNNIVDQSNLRWIKNEEKNLKGTWT